MLHIVSELLVAGVLATAAPDAALATAGLALPEPPAAVLQTVPDLPIPVAAPTHADARTFGRASPAERLDKARGGTDIVSDTRLGGEVANNTAVQVVTGANSINAGSFSGSVGLPVVIQNSGANVLIQNATVINLQFK